MKKYAVSVIFVFISILLILVTSVSSTDKISSTELNTKTSEYSSQIRIDYVDDHDRITFASDKGYATVIKTYKDEKLLLEEYFDEDGHISTLPAGYSKIQRVYNDEGLNTRILYLDAESRPVVISSGYDTIRRSWYEDGHADTDTYWISDKQVGLKSGYWQYKRVYKDGKLSEIRFLDRDGNLINNTYGYALIRRSYTDTAIVDLYFDKEGQPVTSTLGQYGQKNETVDGVQTITYLGIDGKAENTDRGYAVVKRTGAKTLYYDKDGDPVTIGRNQYGIEKVNGQSVYLDEDGERMFRLDNVLNTHPRLVLILGIAMTALAIALKGRGRTVFLISYIAFIGLMTICYRETGESRGAFQLFNSYKDFLHSDGTRQNILNNIWLFLPLGAALYTPRHRHLWLWAVGLSVLIETIQYFTGIGLCEVDDVISNGLGALIGYGTAYTAYVARLYGTVYQRSGKE